MPLVGSLVGSIEYRRPKVCLPAQWMWFRRHPGSSDPSSDPDVPMRSGSSFIQLPSLPLALARIIRRTDGRELPRPERVCHLLPLRR